MNRAERCANGHWFDPDLDGDECPRCAAFPTPTWHEPELPLDNEPSV